MEGGPSKINPLNSHLFNPIHKEAMKLGEQQKKRSRSLSPLLPPQLLQPTHDITQVCLFGSIKG